MPTDMANLGLCSSRLGYMPDAGSIVRMVVMTVLDEPADRDPSLCPSIWICCISPWQPERQR